MQKGMTVAAVATCYNAETEKGCTAFVRQTTQAIELHKYKELPFA